MKNYIPARKHWKSMFKQYNYYTTVDRVPIENIKIDRSLFAFDNPVDTNQVLYMLMNFEQEAWEPITVNKDYYLLDGQHRLACARQKCLEFIDVVIRDESKMK